MKILTLLLYAYCSNMLFYLFIKLESTFHHTSTRHLSLHNMARVCQLESGIKEFPFQCSEIIKHPPSNFIFMWMTDVFSNFSFCGFTSCEELFSLKVICAWIAASLVMKSPVIVKQIAKRIPRKIKLT